MGRSKGKRSLGTRTPIVIIHPHYTHTETSRIKMAKGKSAPRTSKKEEEALIKMFSRDVSNKGQASFFVNALLAAATPVFLFIRIQQVDLASAWHVMAVFTCATAY